MTRGLELLIAQTILQGFDAQYGRFLEVTSGAPQRFEHADWHAVQQAMKQRIHLYDHHVGLVVEQLRCTRTCCRITLALRLRRAFLILSIAGCLTTAR